MELLDIGGGNASVDTLINNGGEEILHDGTASATTVMSGGLLLVSVGLASTGAIADGLTLSGGTAILSGSAGAGQIVTFVGAGGDLVLDNLSAFSAQIAGFDLPSQKIDLGGFTYSSTGETRSWTEAAGGASGTLTVSDGRQVAALTLLGNYVTSNFTLSNDGSGGTFIVDPAISGGTARFAQATATFGRGSGLPAGRIESVSASSSLFGALPLSPTSAAHG